MEVISNHVYTHYKGGEYTVLFTAQDSTNARVKEGVKNEVVVYVSLTNGSVWCRDLSEFTELVEWSDGSKRPRFVAE